MDESRGSVHLVQGRRGGAHRTALAIQQGLDGEADIVPSETSEEKTCANQQTDASDKLPEYLEQPEIERLIQLAPNHPCKLMMLIQWRAGLRISEALDLERADLRLDSDRPTLRVRRGKGQKARIVPVHPELADALRVRLAYGGLTKEERLVGVRRSRGSEWITEVRESGVVAGVLTPTTRFTSHTLRHSYARHLLSHGIPVNVLSRWLGHASIDTTLVYLELLPDPTGSLAAIP